MQEELLSGHHSISFLKAASRFPCGAQRRAEIFGEDKPGPAPTRQELFWPEVCARRELLRCGTAGGDQNSRRSLSRN
jgi:hypothetical protein